MNGNTVSTRLIAGLLLLAAGLPTTAALAQGNADTSARSQSSRSDSGGQNAPGQSRGQIAHVGAGTTNAPTTGYSGPKGDAQEAPGENNLPPLPSAKLCDAYQGSPAYQSCLSVVLRQK